MEILKNKSIIVLLLMLVLVLVMGMPALIFASDAATTAEGALSPASIVWTDVLFIGVAFVFAGGLLWFIKKRSNG